MSQSHGLVPGLGRHRGQRLPRWAPTARHENGASPPAPTPVHGDRTSRGCACSSASLRPLLGGRLSRDRVLPTVVGWSIDSTQNAALVTNPSAWPSASATPPARPSSTRTRAPRVHLLGVHPPSARLRPAALNGLDRRLLRLPSSSRSGAACKSNSSTGSAGGRGSSWPTPSLRVPRDLPQPPAPPLHAWHAHTRRVRSRSSTRDSGMTSNQPTPRNSGHPTASTKPGAVQSADRQPRGPTPRRLVRAPLSPRTGVLQLLRPKA